MQRLFIILIAFCIGCYAKIDESKCYETPEADKTLYQLYKNCRKASDSRKTKCMNVVDRYCTDVKYAFIGKLASTTTGIMRLAKTDSNEISFSCIKTTSKSAVEISSLHNEVRACRHLEQIQSKDCLLAVHRYCQKMSGLSSSGFAYTASVSHAKIACFESTEQRRVTISELADLQPQCNDVSGSASSDCFTAACTWCENKGYSGGITQGSDDSSSIIVSCYNDHFSKTVRVKNTSIASKSEYYYRKYLAAKEREQAQQESDPQELDDSFNNVDEYRFQSDIMEE